MTEAERAVEKALTFLERKDRTVAEVRERLSKAGFAEEAREAAVAKLAELGYLNDEDYARRFLESLIGKGRGRIRIAGEMRRKGLGEDMVRFAIEDGYPREAEAAAAQRVAEQTVREIPAALWESEPRKAQEKVSRRLVGRGFPYEIIGEVMARLRNEGEG
jgi:regulatory protein